MARARTKDEKKGLLYYLIVIAYIGLMTLAFYVSAEKQGIIPTFPPMLRYACDVGVIMMAVVYYLVTYMNRRLRVAAELAWVWSIPYFGMALFSLMIWIASYASLNYIARGLTNVGCAELNALAVVCAIWLFGEKAVDFTFYGAVGAVGLVAVRAVMIYGVGGFIGQYISLLITFADNTGPAMHYMEFHDLGQGLGLFLMYYIWMTIKSKGKDRKTLILLVLSFLCFTLSLKRIDVMAMIVGIGMALVFEKLKFKSKWLFIIGFEAALVFFSYVYLVLIKQGYYGIIMNSLGIDTMSRDVIYDYYKDFFDFSPTFFGRGLRFTYVHMLETDEVIRVSPSVYLKVINAHNEYMTYFIELGFWGFIFWLWSNSWFKINSFRRTFGWEAITFTLMVVLYSFISYASDNTFFYYAINYVGFVTCGATVLASRKAKEFDL